jgi:hypothetical protein
MMHFQAVSFGNLSQTTIKHVDEVLKLLSLSVQIIIEPRSTSRNTAAATEFLDIRRHSIVQ